MSQPKKSLSSLLAPYLTLDPAAERMIGAITTDNRQLDADTLWLAARGVSHHALDYYHGEPAAAIVYEPPYPAPPPCLVPISARTSATSPLIIMTIPRAP